MATFVANCSRCGSIRTTFDCYSSIPVEFTYGWKVYCEIFAVCRVCHKSSILLVSQKEADDSLSRILQENNKIIEAEASLTDFLKFEKVVASLDQHVNDPPEHLPQNIEQVVREANKCLSAQCWNASGAMYRLALDLATKGLLPLEGDPTNKVRRNLGLRLPWLFKNRTLPADLETLAECLQQDGNDGAHDGSLGKEDAEDLHDFCYELLRRLYTEPARIQIAKDRRLARRKQDELKKQGE